MDLESAILAGLQQLERRLSEYRQQTEIPVISGGGSGAPSPHALDGAHHSGTLALAQIADGATAGVPLVAGGGGGDPQYAALNLAGGASVVTGLLPDGNVAATIARDGEVTAAIATHATIQTGVHGLAITAGKTLSVTESLTLTAGDTGLTFTFPAASGAVPTGAGTLTVSTINDATIANHTHAITSSSNPGAAASILASDASGYLRLTGFGVGAAAWGANVIAMADGGIIGCDATSPCIQFDNSTPALKLKTYLTNFVITDAYKSGNLEYPGNLVFGHQAGASPGSRITAGYGNVILGGGYRTGLFTYGPNLISGTGYFNTILNGVTNTISASGNLNLIASCSGGTISGISNYCLILSGTSQTINACSTAAIIYGNGNSIANSNFGLAAGDACAVSAHYGYAFGRRSKTAHAGAFLWADQTDADFNSLAVNEFAIRARGGFRHAYDDSNYWTAVVSSAGAVTFDAVGAGSVFSFSDDVGIGTVPDTRFDIDAGAMEFAEMSAPAGGAANTARLFCQDNGAGKSQLCVIFNTGAIQVLATEP